MSGATSSEFASLGPMLLARKGSAKPAMRAQLDQNSRMAALHDDLADLASSQDALGWNDMGEDVSVVSLPVAIKRQPIVPTKRSAKTGAPAPAKDRRAAFTLRLDAERHLKLRLASTIRNCSAQALVTEALDALLGDIPNLDTFAAQLRSTAKKS